MREPAKIIIADDDRDDQQLFREALDRNYAGRFTVQAVFNGVELMQRLHERNADVPDIIVLDLNMPLKDGVSALKEIRSEPRYSHVPVFMLSTSSRPSDMDECRELGCSEYYIKPYRLAEYGHIISDMLHRTFHEID